MFCALSTDTSPDTHVRLKIIFSDLAYDPASVLQWKNNFTAEVRCNLIILPHIYPRLLALNFSVEKVHISQQALYKLRVAISLANHHNRRGKVGKIAYELHVNMTLGDFEVACVAGSIVSVRD